MSCFDLVCGYDDIKAELMRIHDVLRHREKYEKLSVKRPRGLLDPKRRKAPIKNARRAV